MSCARRYRRWIDHAFVGSLSARRWALLSAHIKTCEPCRQAFDELGYVERALSRSSPLSAGAADRILRSVLVGTSPSEPRRRWAWAGVGVTAVAVAAAALFVFALPPGSGFTPRGMESRWQNMRPPGVRVFCVDRSASRVVAETRAVETALPAPHLRCKISMDLQLAYSTPNIEGLTMVAWARDNAGELFYYAPHAGGSSEALDANATDAVFGWSSQLAAKHKPGTYDVRIGLFDGPVAAGAAARGEIVPIESLHLTLVISEDSP